MPPPPSNIILSDFLFAFPCRTSHTPLVGSFNYQRTNFAYHGCDRTVAESVLLGRSRREPIRGVEVPALNLDSQATMMKRLAECAALVDLLERRRQDPGTDLAERLPAFLNQAHRGDL